MDGGGFEPPKSSTTDLQSAPFGHSGTHPANETQFDMEKAYAAAYVSSNTTCVDDPDGIRTHDLRRDRAAL